MLSSDHQVQVKNNEFPTLTVILLIQIYLKHLFPRILHRKSQLQHERHIRARIQNSCCLHYHRKNIVQMTGKVLQGQAQIVPE